MITLRRLCWFALLLTATAVQAGEPRAFVSGTLQQIAAAHHGKPFILGLWSQSCSHCREELTMLGQLMAKHPDTPLVLLSTDTIEESVSVAATLRGYGLANVESWVFADPYTERLQYEIDNRWYGELPRTYLYESNGTRTGHSGRLDMPFLQGWLSRQGVAQR
jgi:thiol-disulfide isomerase/thioredoxin